jgi:methylmalonyl-CoA mutase
VNLTHSKEQSIIEDKAVFLYTKIVLNKNFEFSSLHSNMKSDKRDGYEYDWFCKRLQFVGRKRGTMNLSKMKEQTFPAPALNDWQKAAEKALKGKSVTSLHTKTYEGIDLKPLYRAEDLPDFDRVASYIPDIEEKLSGTKDWYIAQNVKRNSWHELSSALNNALSRGQNCLSFSIDSLEADEEFDHFILNTADASLPIFNIEKDNLSFLDRIADLAEGNPTVKNIHGIFGFDPVSEHAFRQYEIPFKQWFDSVEKADRCMPDVKTVIVNTAPYHQSGSNAVQELSYALSEGVMYIERLLENGWALEKIARKIHFHFSVESHFFMEIAKLRAFKKLWQEILITYGLGEDMVRKSISISAETSRFNKSMLDSHVNMLRSGGEAFSAILAGVNYLVVHPFDWLKGESDPFSERIARNMQLILGEEAHLNKVTDPGGGSYYLEWLTDEVGKKSWTHFQSIDSRGGLQKLLISGVIREEVMEMKESRMADLSTRKQSMIGTNIYSNLEDVLPPDHAEDGERLSLPFEQLRKRAQILTERGIKPNAGIIGLKELKSFKARADFVSGFLATGGIHSKVSQGCFSKEDILRYIEETNLSYYIVCGRDEDYEEFLPLILELVKNRNAAVKVDIAGQFDAGKMIEWERQGLNGSIYFKQDMLVKLNGLLSIWEEEHHVK